METDDTVDGSSESTPKRLQDQRRLARHWLCAGASYNGDRGKVSIESSRTHERRWIFIFLRQYAFPLVLCCAGAALFLAWYIPYLFPEWYSAATHWLDAHLLFTIVLSIILLVFLLFWLLLGKLPQWQVAAVPEIKDRIDLESRLLLDSRGVDVPRSYNSIVVTPLSWNTLFFNGLKNGLRFSEAVGV